MKPVIHICFWAALCAMVVNYSPANAQENICDYEALMYRPFVEAGKQWIVVCATSEIFWVKNYYIAGDTVLTNRKCSKLMCHTINYEKKTETHKLYSILYEEDKKVYYYLPDESYPSEPVMLYDFGAKTGDVVSLGGQPSDISAQAVYRIWEPLVLENNGECFRGMQASYNDAGITEVNDDSAIPLFQWYESIGSVFEPFEKCQWNMHMSGPLWRLYECKVGNEVIYSKTMGLVLAINHTEAPATPYKILIDGQVLIQRGDKTYTLQGQEVK